MKEVSESRLEHIMAAEPGLRIEERNGERIAVIARYDIDTDTCSEVELKIIPDPKPVGNPGWLKRLVVRHGPRFNPEGTPYISPLGHLFRIVDPPKDDQP